MEPVAPSPRKRATLADLMPRLTDNLFLKYESNPKKFELLANCMICCQKYSSPPIQYDCGHRVCESCHVKLATKAVVSPTLKNAESLFPIVPTVVSPFQCPFCKSSVTSMMKDQAYYRENVMALQLKCPNSVTGCEWSGCLSDVAHHLNVLFECPEERFDCSACDVPIKGKEMTHHILSECIKRPVLCQYCTLEMAFDTLELHYQNSCAEYPVPCPLDCGVSPLPKSALLHHEQNICENALVPCPYRCVNCFHSVQRKNMPQHLTEFTQQHMGMTCLFAHSATTEVASMKREFDEFRAQLNKEKESASAEILTLRRELEALKAQLPRSQGTFPRVDVVVPIVPLSNSNSHSHASPLQQQQSILQQQSSQLVQQQQQQQQQLAQPQSSVLPLSHSNDDSLTSALVSSAMRYWKTLSGAEFMRDPWIPSSIHESHLNRATLVADCRSNTHGKVLRGIFGKQACVAFSVSIEAWPFVVGFKSDSKVWTFSSTKQLEVCSLLPKVEIEYRSLELPDIPLYPTRENTLKVGLVRDGTLSLVSSRFIQFHCNGKAINIDTKLVVPNDVVVYPCVYMARKGDCVAMLDYSYSES